MTDRASSPPDVARYYDRNTRRFLRFGGSGGRGTIHRALWGPGVASAGEAAGFIHGWMTRTLRTHAIGPVRRILDLGCGVGATLEDLAADFPEAFLHGVTLSREQVHLARARLRRAGLEGRSQVQEADFQALALGVRAEAALAIEAYAHATDPHALLQSAARHLSPGGLLVIVDDVLARPRSSLSPREARILSRFESGWHLGRLGTLDDLVELAREAGFHPVAREDLSSFLRLDRPRDRFVALAAPLLRPFSVDRFPYAGNLMGGHALQVGLREGWIRYQAVVLRRDEALALDS